VKANHGLSIFVLAACVLGGCSTTGITNIETTQATDPMPEVVSKDGFMPSLIGDPTSINDTPVDELRRLNLVATSMVSILLQVPELEAITATLQVAEPATPFGNVLLRVMEDAGIALQLVPNDEGVNYVSYGQRFSETDAGAVNDFHLAVNNVSLTREFTNKADGIYPTSLVTITGTRHVEDIVVNDELFVEQGGSDSFVSGARSTDAWSPDIREVSLNEYDRIPVDKQTPREVVIADARRQYFDAQPLVQAPNLANYDRYRRVVFVFEDAETLFLGAANKQAVRLMVREVGKNDILVIEACQFP